MRAGDGSSCADGAGVPNGDAVEDACGVCAGDGSSCADCAGVPNGDSVEDVCGICDGDGTSDASVPVWSMVPLLRMHAGFVMGMAPAALIAPVFPMAMRLRMSVVCAMATVRAA